jgi:hypothetical protein
MVWTGAPVLVIVGGMAKANILDRVATDLANSRTQPAIQRLSSLVAAHPTDLDLRMRLASIYRLTGNLVEAGRWAYLYAGADPAEIGAFERAFPSPAVRLRKLRWPARDAHAATEYARRRLAELAAAAGRIGAAGTTGTGSTAGLARALSTGWPRAMAWRRRRYAVAAGVVTTPFAVLGAVTVVQWIVG